MKISILSPDLSHNCLGRAYLLAKILQRRYAVEIVGPLYGEGIWEPVRGDESIPYKHVKIQGKFRPYGQLLKLASQIEGDVLYASKPLMSSLGVGIRKKLSAKKPLVLDIDDWDLGFIKNILAGMWLPGRMAYLARSAVWLYSVGSYWNAFIMEKLVPIADAITVSNSFLHRKFGGTIIPHGRDTEVFDPARFDRDALRQSHGIGLDRKVVMFFGSPRPYKGVEDVIEASGMIRDENVLTVLVGLDRSPYSQGLQSAGEQTLGPRFRTFGEQPFEKVPEFLAMADVVVVPQRENIATQGQVPAKVFDAMAMARPVVATAVSDLPEILDGCGWITEPQNPKKLAEAINSVLQNPLMAEETGRKARKRCIEKYSLHAIEKSMAGVFQKYE
jgi:glycosyltransferase involved in cell wall biosynthesis